MLDYIKNNLVTIGAVVLIVLCGYAYWMYFGDTSAPSLESSDTAVSQDLLSALSSLHTIKLDTSLFTDPAYKSLSDFGVVIPSQDVGRPNPFLPVSSGAARR